MKKIDWNEASELGLIERINRQVLHPLGLAMTRTPAIGASESLLVADDGVFEYAESFESSIISESQIRARLEEKLAEYKSCQDESDQDSSPDSKKYESVGDPWLCISEVLKVVQKAKSGEWCWTKSEGFLCKYVEVRIDMRSGKCLVSDRRGKLLTLKDLNYQYSSLQSN